MSSPNLTPKTKSTSPFKERPTSPKEKPAASEEKFDRKKTTKNIIDAITKITKKINDLWNESSKDFEELETTLMQFSADLKSYIDFLGTTTGDSVDLASYKVKLKNFLKEVDELVKHIYTNRRSYTTIKNKISDYLQHVKQAIRKTSMDVTSKPKSKYEELLDNAINNGKQLNDVWFAPIDKPDAQTLYSQKVAAIKEQKKQETENQTKWETVDDVRYAAFIAVITNIDERFQDGDNDARVIAVKKSLKSLYRKYQFIDTNGKENEHFIDSKGDKVAFTGAIKLQLFIRGIIKAIKEGKEKNLPLISSFENAAKHFKLGWILLNIHIYKKDERCNGIQFLRAQVDEMFEKMYNQYLILKQADADPNLAKCSTILQIALDEARIGFDDQDMRRQIARKHHEGSQSSSQHSQVSRLPDVPIDPPQGSEAQPLTPGNQSRSASPHSSPRGSGTFFPRTSSALEIEQGADGGVGASPDDKDNGSAPSPRKVLRPASPTADPVGAKKESSAKQESSSRSASPRIARSGSQTSVSGTSAAPPKLARASTGGLNDSPIHTPKLVRAATNNGVSSEAKPTSPDAGKSGSRSASPKPGS